MMPARSEAQRRLLNARFGHAWVKKHHFDNTGPLPARAGQKGRRAVEPKIAGNPYETRAMIGRAAPAKGKKKGKKKGGMKKGKKSGDGFGGCKFGC